MSSTKNLFYNNIPHDSNASGKANMLEMRSVYGAKGYGLYWLIIELMREQPEYMLPINGKHSQAGYAIRLQCTEDDLREFITACVDDFQLFSSDPEKKLLWSESLLLRMAEIEVRSETARSSAEKRWNKDDKDKDTTALQPQSESKAHAMLEKKRKEDIRKEHINKRNIFSLQLKTKYKKITGDELGTVQLKDLVTNNENELTGKNYLELEKMAEKLVKESQQGRLQSAKANKTAPRKNTSRKSSK